MTALLPSRPPETSRGCIVTLGGWYGAANLGDELILSTFVDWVREAGGTPRVISVHPAHTRAMLDVDAADYTSLAEVVEGIAACDLFVLGGGGLFQNYDVFDRASLDRFPARNVSQFAQYFLLARELGIPAVVLAQGVGPLRKHDAREITATVFEEAELCSVRDKESAALLTSIGVRRLVPIAADPAWAFRGTSQSVSLRERFPQFAGLRVLTLVVRDWPFDAHWEDEFVGTLKAAIPKGWGCLWLDFARTPSADVERVQGSEIAHRLIARLGDERVHVVWEGMRLDEAIAIISASDAMIAMRLHAALLGHRAGIPVVTLEYDDKVRVLGDELRVPHELRFPLARIATALPAALTIACAADREPFRVDAHTREQCARSALAHRDLLREAMSRARSTTEPVRPLKDLRWASRWLSATPEAAERVAAAIERRWASHRVAEL